MSHGWCRLAPFEWTGGVLRRVEAVGRRVLDVEISFDGRALQVKGGVEQLRPRIVRMFQLDVDTSDFITRTRTSPSHAWVEPAGFGRMLCGSTLFEDVVKIVLTTNTMWRQTVRMAELLVGKCGRSAKSGRKAFPDPADVARFTAAELQEYCRLGYRAKSIHALATGIANGTIDLAKIADPSQSTEELFASYRTLPGIGPYGAAHLLAMDGRHDVIAVDTEFRKFVRERYHKGRTVSDKTMLRRYSKWGKWKYLAYWAELWEGIAPTLEDK